MGYGGVAGDGKAAVAQGIKRAAAVEKKSDTALTKVGSSESCAIRFQLFAITLCELCLKCFVIDSKDRTDELVMRKTSIFVALHLGAQPPL